MKAGLIGAVAVGGGIAAAVAWTQLAPDPDRLVERSADPVATAAAPDTPTRDRAPPRLQSAEPPAARAPGSPASDAPARPPPDGGSRSAPTATASETPGPAPGSEEDRGGSPGELAALDKRADGAAPGRAAGPDPAPQERAGPLAPSFDIVRVDADGQTVIAGRSEPNQSVEVLLDGRVVETAIAGATGRFVAILSTEPSSAARELRLRVALSDPPSSAGAGRREAAYDGTGSVASTGLAQGDGPGGAARSTRAGPAQAAGDAPGPLAPPPLGKAAGVRQDGASPREARPEAGAAAAPDSVAAPAPPGDRAGGRFLLSDAVIILPTERAGTAPALVQVQDDALALLQPGGADATGVVLDQLTQGPDGDLLLRGRARPGHAVRIYGNGQPIETVPVDDGDWSLSVPSSRAGSIRLFRLDEIARSGAVASRVEVPFKPSDAADHVVRDREITVRRGDNLWRIAEQHYGDGIRYSLIFGANGDLIRDPDLIYPDQVFTIPELVEAE